MTLLWFSSLCLRRPSPLSVFLGGVGEPRGSGMGRRDRRARAPPRSTDVGLLQRPLLPFLNIWKVGAADRIRETPCLSTSTLRKTTSPYLRLRSRRRGDRLARAARRGGEVDDQQLLGLLRPRSSGTREVPTSFTAAFLTGPGLRQPRRSVFDDPGDEQMMKRREGDHLQCRSAHGHVGEDRLDDRGRGGRRGGSKASPEVPSVGTIIPPVGPFPSRKRRREARFRQLPRRSIRNWRKGYDGGKNYTRG